MQGPPLSVQRKIKFMLGSNGESVLFSRAYAVTGGLTWKLQSEFLLRVITRRRRSRSYESGAYRKNPSSS